MASIRKIGPNKWQIDYRRMVNGFLFGKKETITGTKGFAQEVLIKKQTELERMIKLGERPEDNIAITVDDVLDGLIDFYRIKERRSIDRLERSAAKLKDYFSGRRADTLTVDDIERWRQWRYKQPTQRDTRPKPATVNRELAALKTAFSRAVKNRKLDHNPAIYVEPDSENNQREIMWTDDQLKAVWKIAVTYQRIILSLLYFCGLRRTEAAKAKFSDIDSDGFLIIPPETDKAGRGRKVPIPTKLLMYLRANRRPNQTHLIWYRKGPIKDFRGTIQGLQKRAKLETEESLWTHDFRRSYEHHARRAGIDERTIRAIIGHSQGSDAHARYIVVSDDDLIQAGKTIQQGLLSELLTPEILLVNSSSNQ